MRAAISSTGSWQPAQWRLDLKPTSLRSDSTEARYHGLSNEACACALEDHWRTASVWQAAQGRPSFSSATSIGFSPWVRTSEGKNGPSSRGSLAVSTGAAEGCAGASTLA